MDQPRENSSAAIRAIAQEGGNLGIEIVDVAGRVEDVAGRMDAEAKKFHALRATALEVLECDRAMGESAKSARQVARDVAQESGTARGLVEAALADIRALVGIVEATATRLEDLRTSLENVSKTAAGIADIALQTSIVAINASVEAAHAGAKGAGFAVIAQAVRALAQETSSASKNVDSSLKVLATLAGQLAEASQQGTRKAQAVGNGTRSITALVDLVDRATQEIDRRAEGIDSGAQNVERRISGFLRDVTELDTGVEASSTSLAEISERLNGLMGLAERIVGLAADTGVPTADRSYVELAMATAGAIEQRFADEIASGKTTMGDFFDEAYVPIPGTNPPQFEARFSPVTDRVLPDLLEPPLESDPQIVFVVAVDRNGYLPTHNRKFSHPQGSDPEWNKANCRNRRMFDDRVGLAAARSTKPFLIQCYRRDMGGGHFALMKDASAPIFVQGRHWGALRVAFRT